MGQRLNLEIRYGKEVLANSYYHWSAYTRCSLELTKIIIDKIEQDNINFNNYDTRIMNAVRLLELTGSGINNEEKQEIDLMGNLNSNDFKKCTDRNNGLLSVSRNGISNSQFCAEHTVIIDVLDMSIDISDMFDIKTKEEYLNDCKEYNEENKYDEFKTLKYLSLKDMNFNEVRKIYKEIEDIVNDNIYYAKWNGKNGEKILSFIE